MRVCGCFTDRQAPARLEGATQLTKRTLSVEDLAEHEVQVASVETVVRVREPPCIASDRDDVRGARLVRPASNLVQHLLLDIQNVEGAWLEPPSHVEVVVEPVPAPTSNTRSPDLGSSISRGLRRVVNGRGNSRRNSARTGKRKGSCARSTALTRAVATRPAATAIAILRFVATPFTLFDELGSLVSSPGVVCSSTFRASRTTQRRL